MDDSHNRLLTITGWVHGPDNTPLEPHRAIVSMIWSQAAFDECSDLFGPLVDAQVRIDVPANDALAQSTGWVADAIDCVRPGADHDIAQAGRHAVTTPHYEAFVSELVRIHPHIVPKDVLVQLKKKKI